jgi:transposase
VHDAAAPHHLAGLARALGAVFPELAPLPPLRLLGAGFHSTVVETPDERVFRIGKTPAAAAGYAREVRFLLHTRANAQRGPDVVRFLQHLLRRLPGKLLVLWDGAPIHHARPGKAFLATGAAARLRLVQLPGYAPDLNPLDQGVWHLLKHVELANVCCADLPHLRRELHAGAERLRRRPHLIHSCIQHAGYRL